MQIINPDVIAGPCRRPLADEVLRVAEDFDREYLRPDDPFMHGRSFTVIEAQAELVLRLTRTPKGVESITIVAVNYWHTEAQDTNSDD